MTGLWSFRKTLSFHAGPKSTPLQHPVPSQLRLQLFWDEEGTPLRRRAREWDTSRHAAFLKTRTGIKAKHEGNETTTPATPLLVEKHGLAVEEGGRCPLLGCQPRVLSHCSCT